MAIFLSPGPTHIFIFICDSYMGGGGGVINFKMFWDGESVGYL